MFHLLECVFVYIFMEGVRCLVVELRNTASLLYNVSCDLTNWSKTGGPMRDPFGERGRGQRAGLFLFSVSVIIARKDIN